MLMPTTSVAARPRRGLAAAKQRHRQHAQEHRGPVRHQQPGGALPAGSRRGSRPGPARPAPPPARHGWRPGSASTLGERFHRIPCRHGQSCRAAGSSVRGAHALTWQVSAAAEGACVPRRRDQALTSPAKPVPGGPACPDLPRRPLLGAAAALLAMPRLARAQQAWPDKPIRYVIGGAAGGVSDIFLRMMETRLRERLGQPLVIEPRPGAGGMIGAEVTARSAPDGYTFYVNHIATHGIGPTLYKRPVLRSAEGPAGRRAPRLPAQRADREGRQPDHIGAAELVAFIRANPARGHLRLRRHRHLLPPLGRAAGPAHRGGGDACALSRHRALHGGGDERRGAVRHRQRAGQPPAGAGRDAARARRLHRAARQHHAGAADACRNPACRISTSTSWYGIAAPRRRAAPDRRPPRRRVRRRPERPRHRAAHARLRRRAGAAAARRVRRLHARARWRNGRRWSAPPAPAWIEGDHDAATLLCSRALPACSPRPRFARSRPGPRNRCASSSARRSAASPTSSSASWRTASASSWARASTSTRAPAAAE